jgi:four helix bundle protein
MQDFRSLNVWQKSHFLTLTIYRLTAGYPRNELYGLTSQLRRGCISIAANIAEGCGRRSDTDFARFLQMSMGSASEVEYLLLLSRDLKFLDPKEFEAPAAAIVEIKRMIAALLTRLRGGKK